MKRRVVITGMGAVTPLGLSVDDLYRNQIEGKSGVDLISLFDASKFPTKFAAEIKGFELGKYVSNPKDWSNSGANSCFAVAAAQQAVKDSGIRDNGGIDPTRMGVYLGSGEGIQDFH